MAEILNPGFTRPQGEVAARQQAASVPGMAHFAHTGPDGTTCRMCQFWGNPNKTPRRSEGLLTNRRCRKFRTMNMGEWGAGIPPDTPTCRHFTQVEKVPALYSERRRKAVQE